MAVEVITKEDLQAFRLQLLEDLEGVVRKIKDEQTQKGWLRNQDLKKMLGVSDGTLFTLRQSGKLRASKIGNLYFYQREDVEKMLKQNLLK